MGQALFSERTLLTSALVPPNPFASLFALVDGGRVKTMGDGDLAVTCGCAGSHMKSASHQLRGQVG